MQQLSRTTDPPVSAEDCAHDLLATVPGLMRFIRHEMRRHREVGLTIPQFRSLIFVSVNEDTSLSATAEHVGLSLPAASRMVQLMVRRGLIERREDPDDRRRVSLSPTRKGRDAYRAARAATQVALVGYLSKLPPAKLAEVSEVMHVLQRLFNPPEYRPELVS